MNYEIDYNDKMPVYKQIVRRLNEAILNGEFSELSKLPTERELSDKFKVARGTIKNAFGELEKQGKIRKIQGSGTFPVSKNIDLEKEFVVKSISKMIDSLIKLNLSEDKIKRMVIKELWSRLESNSRVSLAWIDCSIELLGVTAKQISDKCNVEVTTFLVKEILANPELIRGKFDIVATTLSHYDELISVTSKNTISMERLILTVGNKTVSEIAKLTKEDKIAILYKSDDFLELVNDNIKRINDVVDRKYFNIDENIEELISQIHNYNVIIIPPEYNSAATDDNDYAGEFVKFVHMCKGKKIIVFKYILDKGSLIHLEEQAQRFWVSH